MQQWLTMYTHLFVAPQPSHDLGKETLRQACRFDAVVLAVMKLSEMRSAANCFLH